MPSTRVRSRHRLLLIALVLLVVAIAAATALAWRPAIAPVTPPAPAIFSPALVRQGQILAAIGNCITCHTVSPMAAYAGGVAIATPFGAIHSTNISPHPTRGIGAWSEAAFRRAMRDGVSRDGHHLYPAFPYDHYAKVSDTDLHALYAFLMTREPFTAPPVANHLKFPFNLRPLIAGWNLLYLDRQPLRANPVQSPEWNRGAYLVQSLGHCSACHSPRNALGGEDRHRYLAGGDAEDWYAPALNAESPTPTPWTVQQLSAYLRTGLADSHAIAGGPMQAVVHDLHDVPAAELDAMALYIHTLMGTPTPAQHAQADAANRRATHGAQAAALPAGAATRELSAPAASPVAATTPAAPTAPADSQMQLRQGAELYQGACAQCHDAGRQLSSGGALQLPLAIALYEPDPRNLLHLILQGVQPGEGEPGRWMPRFADSLTDAQVAALAAYLRRTAADAPPWRDLNAAVAKARK